MHAAGLSRRLDTASLRMAQRMGTVTRAYDTFSQAERVVRELHAAGVASAAISLIAMNKADAQFASVEDVAAAAAGAGAAVGGGAGLLAGLGLLAIPGLGPVVAAGWLASSATCAAAGAAAGGFIGAMVGTGIEKGAAQTYAEIIRRGGTIVSVRAEEFFEQRIGQIMDQFDPIDVSEREARYRAAGWSSSIGA